MKTMKLNLRETFLITLLLVALLPILALSGLNMWVLSKDEITDRSLVLESSLNTVYHHYEKDRTHLEATLKNITSLWNKLDCDICEENIAEIQSTLSALKNTSALDFLTLVAPDETVISRANTDIRGDKTDFIKLVNLALNGNTVISNEIIKDSILKNEGNELIEKTHLYKIITSSRQRQKEIDNTQGIFIVGLTPIYCSQTGKVKAVLIAAKHISKDDLEDKVKYQTFSDIFVDIQPASVSIDPDRNIAFKTLKNFEDKSIANLIVWYDPQTTLKFLSDTQKTALFICLITSLLVLFASFVISNYMARPLKDLDEATKEISKDNFNTIVEVKGPAEIEHLSNAFNKMTAELSEKRRMQENFIATLTHDMRVPLLAEKKALDLIINDDRFELSKDQKTLLENMVSSNQDLLKLVNTLLDTYKLEAGKYRLDLFEHNILDVIRDTISELQPLASEKGQHLFLPSEIDAIIINFDKSEIKRVLRNLVSNAIKFTPKEGEIKVHLCSNEESIIISVTDNGRGMTEEEVSKLFQRYSSGAKKLRKVGTGLGLYLSYQIVQAHKGKMWVETKPNEGSTFYFSIPKQ